MNTARERALRAMLAGGDATTILLTFLAASMATYGTAWSAAWEPLVPSMAVALPASILTCLAVLWTQGLYRLGARWSLGAELRLLARAGAILVAGTLAGLFALQVGVSLRFLLTFFACAGAGLATSRAMLRAAVKLANRGGRGLRHVLVVGSGTAAQRYVRRAGITVGTRLVGYVGAQARDLALPHLGAHADLPRVLATTVVDEVVIALPLSAWREIDIAVAAAEEQGKAARLPLDLRDTSVRRARIESVGTIPTISVANSDDRWVAKTAKRTLDIIGGGIALVVTAPVLLAAVVAVAVTDGAPVLLRQRWTGLHGRDFHALTLRVPRRDPASAAPGPTRLGRLLRRTSIEELPLLLNVLRGDMSLVGPRPATSGEVERYDPRQRRRLSAKPGLTGPWQMMARGASTVDVVDLDLDYIDTWSFHGDLKLLARTPAALLRPRPS